MSSFIAALKFFISILPFIRSTVLAVEALHGPGTGPTKLDKAITAVSTLLPADDVNLAKTASDLLPHVINHTVELMNSSGDLPKSEVTAPA
jgi:hypothetical protein